MNTGFWIMDDQGNWKLFKKLFETCIWLFRIYSDGFYTPLTRKKFLDHAILSFDIKTTSLEITWDKLSLSIHLSNHYAPSKEESHEAPDFSQGMEIFVCSPSSVDGWLLQDNERKEEGKKEKENGKT